MPEDVRPSALSRSALSRLAMLTLSSLALSPTSQAFSLSPSALSPSALGLSGPRPLNLSPQATRRSAPQLLSRRARQPLSHSPLSLKAQLKPEADDSTPQPLSSSAPRGPKTPLDPPSQYEELYSDLKRESASQAANLPSLLLLPVGAAIVMGGLLMPSPEILESVVGTMTEPVQVVAAATQGLQQGGLSVEQLSNPALDPTKFVPVCQFSDGFYRTGQALVYKLAGPQTYQEYAPLIAGSLLRVRLEFCVLESFVYESIIPFIKARGLSWVFPFQETLETFIAGVVFAVATNLVLIGSTKIITIIVSYFDFFIGLPLRLIFGFINDRLTGTAISKNPVGGLVTLGSGAGKLVGQVSGATRRVVEAADVFVGRYLLLTTVGYVILKFLKFKGLLILDAGGFIEGVKAVFSALSSLAS